MAKRKKPATQPKQPARKRNTKPSKTEKPPACFSSHYKDWTDKQEVLRHFRLSDRTLQKLRSEKIIVWSILGGKIYYHMPSFAARLDENRSG